MSLMSSIELSKKCLNFNINSLIAWNFHFFLLFLFNVYNYFCYIYYCKFLMLLSNHFLKYILQLLMLLNKNIQFYFKINKDEQFKVFITGKRQSYRIIKIHTSNRWIYFHIFCEVLYLKHMVLKLWKSLIVSSLSWLMSKSLRKLLMSVSLGF